MSEQLQKHPQQPSLAYPEATGTRRMRRFASIDFLRGTAIVMMLVLHMVSDFLYIDGIFADFDNQGLINVLALAVLPFLGGLAGFFLAVSAIGNMVSMYRQLHAGKSVKDLVTRQVIGGFVLLVFAYLVEALIGYHGAFGGFLGNLRGVGHTGSIAFNWTTFASRGYHFETIHTIAWCIILNGVVQGILSAKGHWKNTRRLIISYLVIAIVVIAVTPFVWDGVAALVPGYPFATNPLTMQDMYTPVVGISPFSDLVAGFFLNLLAAPMEPIFPYLAVSFMGSIIGIVISQPKEKLPRGFFKKAMWLGMTMFIVGIVGVIFTILSVYDLAESLGGDGFMAIVDLYKRISYHRDWYPDYPLNVSGNQYPVTFPGAWLWQFLSLNGVGLMMIVFVVRMVEFRGWSAGFAKKTTMIRRFGLVAFTVYNNQFIMWIVSAFMGTFFYGEAYKSGDWGFVGLSMLMVFALYIGMLMLWERAKYTGTLEWCIGTIGYNLIPGKKGRAEKAWWQKGQIDPKESLYDADWVNVVEARDIPREQLVDSKLAFKFAIGAIVSLLFMPVAFATWRLALSAEKTEGKNKYNQRAKVLSIVGMCIVIGTIAALCIVTAGMVGLSF
jgi:hypothetical protein